MGSMARRKWELASDGGSRVAKYAREKGTEIENFTSFMQAKRQRLRILVPMKRKS